MGAIYGLVKLGYLANLDLIKNIAPFGYYLSKITSCIWHHKTGPIKFTLALDYLRGKYVKK